MVVGMHLQLRPLYLNSAYHSLRAMPLDTKSQLYSDSDKIDIGTIFPSFGRDYLFSEIAGTLSP